ncbi:hypothetical protein [Streptomyces sp. NPDC008150]|uniref:hypothetical protein n=1 Tax=Streptomyces sp. NPDC008150 TaxID=3364816 RepID=UPI0036E538FC
MPFPSPPRIPPGPRRRSLFASAAGAALLAGCSTGTDSSGGTGGSPSAVQRVRTRAARDSGDLVARYDAAIAAFPALEARLAPLRAETARHAKAFGAGAAAGPSPAASTTAGNAPAAGSPTPSPSASGAPTEKATLTQLASVERTLADRRTAALVDMPGELARLLASVAAAGAAHTYLLTEAAR